MDEHLWVRAQARPVLVLQDVDGEFLKESRTDPKAIECLLQLPQPSWPLQVGWRLHQDELTSWERGMEEC
eukprot:1693822-Heterocapsa_arctica.AAC.1